MRYLNGLKLVGMLILISGLANADLILDGVSVIDTGDVETVTIDPVTGDMYIDTLSQGYTVTGGATPPPPGSVAIISFTALPSSILEGEFVSLSWSSENATACTGQATGNIGGWDGSAVSPNFSGERVTINIEGTYTFTLRCEGNNGPVVRSRTVVVSKPAGPVPETCDSTPPLSGVVTLWRTFWHIDFPYPGYDNERMLLPRNGYGAIEFNTGDISDHGGIISVANTSSNGTRLGSISACPGEFDVEPECRHSWGSSGGIGWATDGQPGYCQLQPDTTYYMNFTFTNGVDPNSSTCLPSETCYATLQHINLN
jgi:hypothetical protein